MSPPFTIEQFLEVFKTYNLAVFPAQLVLYSIGGVAIYLALKPNPKSSKAISFILALLWLWIGIVYHFIFFTAINKAAYLFGLVFIVQGILFLVLGVFKNKISFQFRKDNYGILGISLITFALIIYPVLGYFLGHVYPFSPTFGLPCPTTIFTFGFLLLNQKRCPIWILIVPFTWSFIGFMAALQLGILEDVSLIVAGLVATSLLVYRKKILTKIKYT
jgi:hypothetical protein